VEKIHPEVFNNSNNKESTGFLTLASFLNILINNHLL
jgi:hypothetical protein